MNSESSRSRRRLVILAGYDGDADVITGSLTDPDPRVRCLALSAAERAGVLTPGIISGAISDDDPEVRMTVCRLATIRSEIDLTPLLADGDERVAEAAAFAAGEQSEPSVDPVPLLIPMATGHPDPLCREAAVAALGSRQDPRGLAAILAATRDKPPVRRRAIIALAPFEGPEVDEALERGLRDRDRQVRQAAEDLLA